MLQGQMANEQIVNSCASKTRHCWTQCQDKTTKMHFANIQMGNFIWGRVYGLGKNGRGKVYDSLQEYSPLFCPQAKSAHIEVLGQNWTCCLTEGGSYFFMWAIGTLFLLCCRENYAVSYIL